MAAIRPLSDPMERGPDVLGGLRLVAAIVLVTVGVGALIAGIAVIYWPAALIVGGVLVALIGATLVNVSKPDRPEDRR